MAVNFRMVFLIAGMGIECLANEKICGNIWFTAGRSVQFTSNEKTLICGDPNKEAWDNVPASQSLFHIQTFLKERGYHHSKSSQQGKNILVDTGEPTRTTQLRFEQAPDHFDTDRFRRVKGQLLTPMLLNEIEQRIRVHLQANGFACPKIKMAGDPHSGVVSAALVPGPVQPVIGVTEQKLQDIDERALRRYDAFKVGETFNADLLRLTEHRAIAENAIQETHFSVDCQEEGVHLKQKFFAGPPRLFTFGFGISTERGPSARIAWKHLRLNETASAFQSALQVSMKVQELSTRARWYFIKSPSRLHFNPGLSLKRENENLYERYTGELQLTPATTWDNQTFGITWLFGPALNFVKTVRGAGAPEAKFLSLNSHLKLESHYHELLRNSPRDGFELQLTASLAQQNFLSNITAQMVRLDFEHLWNLLNFDPSWAIIGIRGALMTTFSPVADRARIPGNFRHYLGGSNDLRGFSRASLPGPNGALTAVFGSFEIRFTDLFPLHLEPLLFVDAGSLGTEPMILDTPLYWSPGIGLRFDSPIGVFRTTLARGYVKDVPGHSAEGISFYLSYGDEF